jgi:hypothetical protein
MWRKRFMARARAVMVQRNPTMVITLQGHRALTSEARLQDRPLLGALEKVGFRLSSGVDGTG